MIQTHAITKRFDRLQILKGIDIEVHDREIVAIVGPSGAGKTTLLQIVGTLDRPDSGHVIIDGVDPFTLSERRMAAFRNQHIGFVFQFHRLLPEFTALENVMIPALIARDSAAEAERKARELLDFLHLSDRITHKPAELSGGQVQRVACARALVGRPAVAVARALINRPSVVLADEPSGSLDSHSKDELHRLFFDLRRDLGQTFVIVTHDEALAAQADRTIRMRDGVIID